MMMIIIIVIVVVVVVVVIVIIYFETWKLKSSEAQGEIKLLVSGSCTLYSLNTNQVASVKSLRVPGWEPHGLV